tara:strand:- start:261 stop:914 length:654 start_codon:yes stop_codon:yes gene_type:complete
MEKEHFAPYPGNLNEDPVMHLVKNIKHDYQTETNNVLPLAESFANPVRHENFNLFKKIGKAAKSVGKAVTDPLTGKKSKNTKKSSNNTADSASSNDDTTNTGDDSAENDTKDSSELIDDLKNEKTALEQQLTALQDNINNNMSQIDQTDKQISEKKVRNLQQKREILNKLNVVETRNRMLQLSQEKNIYKTKVINTMVAVILGGLTVSALLYVRGKK